MNRVSEAFAALAREKRKGVIPFLCGGRPTRASFGACLLSADRAGATVIEVGIPFSDPIADGPVIASAMHRALQEGVTVEGVFEAVSASRAGVKAALVAMVSVSIVHRIGAARFAKEARGAGFDGVIYPDAPLEEAGRYTEPARSEGLTASLLVAPTTPSDRAGRIAKASSGFVYVLARAGITGAGGGSGKPAGLAERIASLRKVTELPLACGFGISSPEDAASVTAPAPRGAGADAAIVGSALVRRVEESGPENAPEATHNFVCSLVRGVSF
ncbi:MAG: tryptophan synthase subunit alpha [Phycisphaerales bacterium]